MYMGSGIEKDGEFYGWSLSEYVTKTKNFEMANEKLFLATLSKGIEYSDMSTDGNVQGDKIVDFGGIEFKRLDLSRQEIDIVRKLLFYMKRDNQPEFDKLLSRIGNTNPKLLHHLFIQFTMNSYSMPYRFRKYRKLINAEYDKTKIVIASREAARQ
jgi:hypothetical protein